MENNVLGTLIRTERKKKGLTQARLGELIGLKESRVSKIENGAPITPEVASFILHKLGSELQIKVVGDKTYNEKDISFMMSVIHYYARAKNLSLDKAYQYLELFKGLEFLFEYKDIEQSLGYDEIVHDLTKVCAKYGGAIQ